MRDTNGGQGLKTTRRSLAVVEYIAQEGEATVSDVATHLDLSKSTVHGHLRSLHESGFLRKRDDTYRLGLKLLYLGAKAKDRHPLYTVGRDSIRNLTSEPFLEADLNVEEYGRLVSLCACVGGEIDVSHRRYYMHSTSVGKAILAEYPRERIERILDLHGLPERTPDTITSREEFFDELDRTRSRGYGISDQEATEGLRTFGAAITGPRGETLGGISIGGPVYRLDELDREEIVTDLRSAIDRVEADLND